MNILIIPSWYPSSTHPIAGIFFKEQAEALARRGHTVSVAYAEVQTKNRMHNAGFSESFVNGVNTYIFSSINFTPRLESTRHLQQRIALYKMYKKSVKKNGRPDIIHAHGCCPGGALGAWLSRKEGIPMVVTEHSTAFLGNKLSKANLKYVHESIAQANKVIAVGPLLSQKLQEYGAHCTVIPNLINTNRFSISCGKENSNVFSFGFLGFLTYKKRVDNLIQAFDLAFGNDDSASLTIGGDGELFGDLVDLASKAKSAKRITFSGEISRDNAPSFYRKLDCFVLPSDVETFGVVLIEALATGLPVVATRSGGPEMIVNDSNGLLVDLNSVEKLAGAMLFIKDNMHNYDAARIREDCINRFGEDSVIDRIVNVYKEALIR